MDSRRTISRWWLAGGLAATLVIMLANPMQPHAQGTQTPSMSPTLGIEASALTGNIVYVSNRSGTYELYLSSPDGHDVRALTTGDYPKILKWSPSISTDGKQVAYTVNSRENLNAREIYLMNIDGSNQRQITKLGLRIDCLDWSPDMTQFAICAHEDGRAYDIYTLNVDGTGLIRLTDEPLDSYAKWPQWSPDGKKILYHAEQSAIKVGRPASSVYVMDADGSNLTELGEGYEAVWSPDGTMIAYMSRECETPSSGPICIMDADGSNRRHLASSTGVESVAAWSPDGKFLAVYSMELGGRIAVSDIDIFIIAVEGTERIRLTDKKGIEDTLPAWGIAP